MLDELLKVDQAAWRSELEQMKAFFDDFGDRLPPEITVELDGLRARLG